MQRINSNYTQAQYDALLTEATKRGMSLSAYQRYITLLSIPQHQRIAANIPSLIQQLYSQINSLESGKQFIVSSLIDPAIWSNLSRSEKNTIAQHLSSYAAQNPHILIKQKDKLPGKITQYKKL